MFKFLHRLLNRIPKVCKRRGVWKRDQRKFFWIRWIYKLSLSVDLVRKKLHENNQNTSSEKFQCCSIHLNRLNSIPDLVINYTWLRILKQKYVCDRMYVDEGMEAEKQRLTQIKTRRSRMEWSVCNQNPTIYFLNEEMFYR